MKIYFPIYMAFTFSCFILGAAFFRSRRSSRSSSLRCRSGSSISLIRSLISRLFLSRSSWARSALAAWIDFQKASATLLRFFSALFLASRDRRNLLTYNNKLFHDLFEWKDTSFIFISPPTIILESFLMKNNQKWRGEEMKKIVLLLFVLTITLLNI